MSLRLNTKRPNFSSTGRPEIREGVNWEERIVGDTKTRERRAIVVDGDADIMQISISGFDLLGVGLGFRELADTILYLSELSDFIVNRNYE